MLKEIPGACTYYEAVVITGLTEKYQISIQVAPYTPQVDTQETPIKDTLITIKELQEGVIGPQFFGDMYELLQANPEQNSQKVPKEISQSVAGTIPLTSPIQDTSTVTLWSRFKSCLKPGETKSVNPS